MNKKELIKKIINIIYGIVVLIAISIFIHDTLEYEKYEIGVYCFCLVIFVLLLIPFLLHFLDRKKKKKTSKTSIAIVLEVITIALAIFLWISWPAIKNSINNFDECNENDPYSINHKNC